MDVQRYQQGESKTIQSKQGLSTVATLLKDYYGYEGKTWDRVTYQKTHERNSENTKTK